MLHRLIRAAALAAAAIVSAVIVSTGGAAHADDFPPSDRDTWHDPGRATP